MKEREREIYCPCKCQVSRADLTLSRFDLGSKCSWDPFEDMASSEISFSFLYCVISVKPEIWDQVIVSWSQRMNFMNNEKTEGVEGWNPKSGCPRSDMDWGFYPFPLGHCSISMLIRSAENSRPSDWLVLILTWSVLPFLLSIFKVIMEVSRHPSVSLVSRPGKEESNKNMRTEPCWFEWGYKVHMAKG
jgi:hypothetical protein